MFEFIFRRYHYFAIIELGETLNQSKIDPRVLKYIKRFFFFKGHSLNYYEPFTKSLDGKLRLIVGTDNKNNKIKRNTMIFLLELFAHLTNPQLYTISGDFPLVITKTINNTLIQIYKVKK